MAHSHILIPDLPDWRTGWSTATEVQGECTATEVQARSYSPMELEAGEAGTQTQELGSLPTSLRLNVTVLWLSSHRVAQVTSLAQPELP